jgi:Tfp pilus assembly protein PilN
MKTKRNILLLVTTCAFIAAILTVKAWPQELLEQRRMELQQKLDALPPSIDPLGDAMARKLDRIERQIDRGEPLDRERIDRELSQIDDLRSQRSKLWSADPKIIDVDQTGSVSGHPVCKAVPCAEWSKDEARQ